MNYIPESKLKVFSSLFIKILLQVFIFSMNLNLEIRMSNYGSEGTDMTYAEEMITLICRIKLKLLIFGEETITNPNSVCLYLFLEL